MADAAPGQVEQGCLAGGVLTDAPDDLDRRTCRGCGQRHIGGEASGDQPSRIQQDARAGSRRRRSQRREYRCRGAADQHMSGRCNVI